MSAKLPDDGRMDTRKVPTMTRLASSLLAASALAGCATAPMRWRNRPAGSLPGAADEHDPARDHDYADRQRHGRSCPRHRDDLCRRHHGSQDGGRGDGAAGHADERCLQRREGRRHADRDMQTGQISLNAVYEYPNNARPRLTGYQAPTSSASRSASWTR